MSMIVVTPSYVVTLTNDKCSKLSTLNVVTPSICSKSQRQM